MRRQIFWVGPALLLAGFSFGAEPAAACGWDRCGPYGYYAAPPAPVYYVAPPIYVGPPIYAVPLPIYGYYPRRRYRVAYYGSPRRYSYGSWRGNSRANYYGGGRRGHWRR